MEKIIIIITAVMIILIILLASYFWNKKYFLSVYYNNRYDNSNCDNIFHIMRVSRKYFRKCIVIVGLGTLFFGFLSVLSMIDFDAIVFCFFYCFVLLGIYACICALLERYVLTADSLIHYIPLLPPKETKIHEITTVMCREYTNTYYTMYGAGRKMLVGYHNKKKLFSIDESIDGFDFLYQLFLENGKMEHT